MGKKKQVFCFVVALCVAFVFAGCSKKTEIKQDAAAQKPTVVEKKAEAPAKPAVKEEAVKEKAEAVAEVTPLNDIYFDFDKSFIRQQDRETLQKIAAWIKQNKVPLLTIEGHCDERGTAEYNLALGDRRATEAKKYLVTLGVSEKALKTISYGKEKPVDPGHNEEAWAKNRRDHFTK